MANKARVTPRLCGMTERSRPESRETRGFSQKAPNTRLHGAALEFNCAFVCLRSDLEKKITR